MLVKCAIVVVEKSWIDYGYFGDYLGFVDVGDWNLLNAIAVWRTGKKLCGGLILS